MYGLNTEWVKHIESCSSDKFYTAFQNLYVPSIIEVILEAESEMMAENIISHFEYLLEWGNTLERFDVNGTKH